jgi:hypothetical protein
MSLFNSKYLGMDNMLKRTKVTLTSAQILALNTTPITLIPAPGAGKYISVDEIMGQMTFNSVQYTGANALEIRYTDGSGVKATGDFASAWLDLGSTRTDKVIGAAVAVAVANAPIVASVPTANPAAGNSTVTFDIIYRVLALP